jgi:FlaA1/EpsC-like NDP-sugar epimerase
MELRGFKGTAGARMILLLVLYTVTLSISLWLSYQLRFDFDVPATPVNFRAQMLSVVLWAIPLKLVLLWFFRQFAGLLSYFSIPDLTRLVYSIGLSSAILAAVRLLAGINYAPPRGVILTDFVLSIFGLAGIRLAFRLTRERYLTSPSQGYRRARRVGIIGAGDAGATLVRELSAKRGLGLQPVAFFDDDRTKWNSRVHDIQVFGRPEDLLNQKLNLELEEVIIAMPSASAKRIGEVIKILQQARLKFEIVPSLDQLATGTVKVSQLRSVEIQDLLGREPVELQTENIRNTLENRVVMVTGAGGSIGGELCRQIVSFNPQRLLLVEQSEVQIFQIEQELNDLGFGGIILALVADILDDLRMRYIFDRFHPQIIFHSAAHKHVPMMESQPSEAIKNNTLGTVRIAELSLEYGVDRFVQISTDKAINPTNVMGATKRLAEIFLQALHATNPTGSKFMAVRFGNVLGSSGSVIPTFNKQIAAGGPVKVTHPDVTRYFMTIPEAVGLVLQSAAQGSGGEIFVLDMGKPIKIVDLARQLIELNGLKPDEDIQIEFTGLRPGEKLFEELSHKIENVTPTNHPKIMRFVTTPLPLSEVRKLLEELNRELHHAEPNQIKLLLKKAVPEYQPYLT